MTYKVHMYKSGGHKSKKNAKVFIYLFILFIYLFLTQQSHKCTAKLIQANGKQQR